MRKKAMQNISTVTKVELGSAKEIQQKNKDLFQALKEADRAWRNYQDYLTGADKPFTKMIDAYTELIEARADAETSARRFVKAGEELGVDVTSNQDFQKMNKNVISSKDVESIINSFKDPSSFQK